MDIWPPVTQREGSDSSLAGWFTSIKWPRLTMLLAGATVAVILLAALVTLFAPSWRPWRQEATDTKRGVQVSSLQASFSPDDRGPATIHLEMQVKNNTDHGQVIDAWWFLAKPGEAQPWLRFKYQSTRRENLFLEPKSVVELVWEEELAVAAGEYQLSAWVHAGPLGQEKPADGRFLERKLKLTPATLPYIRPHGPADLEIASVAGAVLDDFPEQAPMEIHLPVSLRNGSDRELTADVSWDLVYAYEEQPFEATPALRGGILANQRFAAGRWTTVTFDRQISPRPGRYLLVVRVAAHPQQEGVWDDAKLFTTVLEVTDNTAGDGIARVAEPSGPISIERLGANQEIITSRSPLSVRLDLGSDSSRAEAIRAWWFLSRPGINDPWADNAFVSREVEATIEPGTSQELEIRGIVDVPPGNYELSVWVHVVTDGDEAPSDGAWWARQIVVQ